MILLAGAAGRYILASGVEHAVAPERQRIRFLWRAMRHSHHAGAGQNSDRDSNAEQLAKAEHAFPLLRDLCSAR